MPQARSHIRLLPEVGEALAWGQPVVALESTLISHGLPRPDNLALAHELEAIIRAEGGVPATGLSRTPIGIVCAGVKSILDVGATLERLETLNVTVLGYRTDRFPGFYLADSGFPVDWSVDSPAAAAEVIVNQMHDAAVVIGNPVSVETQLDPQLHARVLTDGLTALQTLGVRGKAITPFLLDYFRIHTGGASVQCNVNLVRSNARLATHIAAAL